MKKFLIILVLVLIATPVFAQARGPLSNVSASWYTVTAAQTTITFPFKTRDLYIHNGDAADLVCVDLRGGTIPANCVTDLTADGGFASIVQLPFGQAFSALNDFVTESISLKSLSATASPVTVIATF